MKAFTHYWKRGDNDQKAGTPLTHVASENFSARGVESGSAIYCVNVHDGALLLIGRMIVDRITNATEAASFTNTSPEFQDRAEHCICTREHGTLITFDREVPLEVAKKLRFESASGRETLAFKSDTQVDPQTVRSIRRLTPESADLLDHLLGGARESGVAG